MPGQRGTARTAPLFELVSARLPLFDGLPEGAIECLAAGGFGRGLMTASIRARLRKTGFVDMGALARATPADLDAVRKIGPVRVDAIRAHILDELARLYPDARAAHSEDATARRRMDLLRATPVEALPLDAATIERLGCIGKTCADLALCRRADCTRTPGISTADLERVIAALVELLLPPRPDGWSTTTAKENGLAQEEATRKARAELLREQDREWDGAAPARHARLTRD